MATKRARLTALLSGGAIPDTADYQVRLEPDGTLVGTVNEDWAIESQRRRHLPARQHVLADPARRARRRARGRRQGPAADAPVLAGRGAGPHARAVGGDRRRCARQCADRRPGGVPARRVRRRPCPRRAAVADRRVRRRRAAQALGAVPTQQRVVLERFFDESGGMQLVVHAPFGVADQPRLGPGPAQALLRRLRLRAAGGGQRGGDRPLARAAAQLPAGGRLRLPAPDTAREVLVQALLAAPMFETRWRWNAQRSLLLERSRNGKKVPAALLRMRADDLLAAAFPQVAGLPGDAARRPDRGADGPPDRAPDDRGLPHRGDGRGRLPRGAARPARRPHRAARRRHRRAVGLRARHPHAAALHASSTTRRSRSAARRR